MQAGRSKDGRGREKQTSLVNQMFDRKGGKLVMNIDNNPFFQEIISKSSEKYKDEYDKGLTIVAFSICSHDHFRLCQNTDTR